LEDKFLIVEEKLNILNEKIKSVDEKTDEKIKVVRAEAELKSTQNYLKYAHEEEYITLRPSHTKKDEK
jgi:hypothetical protein